MLAFQLKLQNANEPKTSGTVACRGQEYTARKRATHSQNVDLPPRLPKNKKKPYPIPLKKITQSAKADKRLAEMGIEKLLEPPKNGLLVPELVLVAYDLLEAWKILIRGLARLLHVVPVYACRYVLLLKLSACLFCCYRGVF